MPTQLEKCFEAVHSKTTRNEQPDSFHRKAVRPPLLLCLSYAVLNLSTRSFIALQEDQYKKNEHLSITMDTRLHFWTEIVFTFLCLEYIFTNSEIVFFIFLLIFNQNYIHEKKMKATEIGKKMKDRI